MSGWRAPSVASSCADRQTFHFEAVLLSQFDDRFSTYTLKRFMENYMALTENMDEGDEEETAEKARVVQPEALWAELGPADLGLGPQPTLTAGFTATAPASGEGLSIAIRKWALHTTRTDGAVSYLRVSDGPRIVRERRRARGRSRRAPDRPRRVFAARALATPCTRS